MFTERASTIAGTVGQARQQPTNVSNDTGAGVPDVSEKRTPGKGVAAVALFVGLALAALAWLSEDGRKNPALGIGRFARARSGFPPNLS